MAQRANHRSIAARCNPQCQPRRSIAFATCAQWPTKQAISVSWNSPYFLDYTLTSRSMIVLFRRFQAIMPADAAAAAQTRLPADPEDLKQAYLLQPKSTLESLEDSRTYSYLWSTITTAQKSIKFNYQPFCTSYNETTSPVCMSSSERLDCFKTR